MVIDDFFGNFWGGAITLDDVKQIKAALGPLRLYVVFYCMQVESFGTHPDDHALLQYIDGVNLWKFNQGRLK